MSLAATAARSSPATSTRSSPATCRGTAWPARPCWSPAPAACCRRTRRVTLLALNDRRTPASRCSAWCATRPRPARCWPTSSTGPTSAWSCRTSPRRCGSDGPLDYVVHGASAARPALHGSDPVGTIRANMLGTFNLLDLCVAKGSRGFVLMSSAEVYGHQPPGTELIDEDSYGGFDILNPRACYSEGKRAAETMCAVYQRSARHHRAHRPVRPHVRPRAWPWTTAGCRPTSPPTSSTAPTSSSTAPARPCGPTPTWPTPSPGMFYALLRGTETGLQRGRSRRARRRSASWPGCSPRCARNGACGWCSPTPPTSGPTARRRPRA